MVISGVHLIVFSPAAEEVRAFLKDTLDLESVDAGGGWPIFALPPAELAVHPADENRHEIYLLCDDIHATVAALEARGVGTSRPITDQGWGWLTAIVLPGGAELSLYQPNHPRPGNA